MDSENSSENEEVDEATEMEKIRIREEVSQMSFEDLQKLKEEIGSKMYTAAVYGTGKDPSKPRSFKRVNKNRPREMSSKIRPQIIKRGKSRITALKSQKHIARDPRFDSKCGEFDKSKFRKNYKFIDEVRKDECMMLKKELNETSDPGRRQQINFLVQRISNQLRESEKLEQRENKEREEKAEIREQREKSEKPIYKKKSDRKIEELIDKYEQLKKSHRLQKHIEKRSKALMVKERKKMEKIQI